MSGTQWLGRDKRFTVGVDIGGTFTDCIVVDDLGNVTVGKAPSTPPSFQEGFLSSMRAASEKLECSLEALASQAEGIYHGCTVGTNALVENRTSPTGLLTTRGHRDSIMSMQAGGRLAGETADYIAHVAAHAKPEPLVPKARIAEIDERVAFDGTVVVELNIEAARAAIQQLLDGGVEAFAISLIWAVANPANEERLATLIEEMAPGAFVSLSSGVSQRNGEYQRTVAATINSLIGPVMRAYLSGLQHDLTSTGYVGKLHIMSCSGGVIEASIASRLPILTIGSGPVAGVIGSAKLASAMTSSAGAHNIGDDGFNATGEDVLTGDVGGTTFDVGVIRGGKPLARTTARQGQFSYYVPTLDVRSVGAGGGSIVRYDTGVRSLRVGPQSAGADPGPAAYRRGGRDATVTDADIALGYLDPDYFLAGAVKLDVDAAREALERAGKPLGFGADETAAAANRIVDNQMADAIRLASVQQGYDPRGFVMYAYGGAGAVHLPAIARELGIRRLVIPLSDLAAGWSAFGVSSSDVVLVAEHPVNLANPFDPAVLNEAWAHLEAGLRKKLEAQGISSDRMTWQREVDMRYSLQVHEVRVPAPAGRCSADTADHLIAAFEREYENLFGAGTGYPDAGFALTAARLTARGTVGSGSLAPEVSTGGPASSPKSAGERGVIWYERGPEREATPVFDGEALKPGMELEGPAIVDFPHTTLVLRHDQRAHVDAFGSTIVDM